MDTRRKLMWLALLVVTGLVAGHVVGWVLLPAALRFTPMLLGKAAPSDLAFWALAGLTVAGAMGTAFSRNIVYSGFALLLSLSGMAGLFVFLSADFLAVTQVLLYVGGVLVLILFAIMLTGGIGDVRVSNVSFRLPVGGTIGFATAGLLAFGGVAAPWRLLEEPALRPTTAALGNALLQEYLLPFEVASVVLLAALVGAVVIVRKEIREEEPPRAG